MSLIGPIVETGNSVLRKHEGFEENFLRVSFVEEDQTKLQIGKMVGHNFESYDIQSLISNTFV